MQRAQGNGFRRSWAATGRSIIYPAAISFERVGIYNLFLADWGFDRGVDKVTANRCGLLIVEKSSLP